MSTRWKREAAKREATRLEQQRALERRQRDDARIEDRRRRAVAGDERRAALQSSWNALRPREPASYRFHPHVEALITISDRAWFDVAIGELVKAHPNIVDRIATHPHEWSPEPGHRDECLICGAVWTADGNYASQHVMTHAMELLWVSPYVLPRYYEDAEVLADALSVAFAVASSRLDSHRRDSRQSPATPIDR